MRGLEILGRFPSSPSPQPSPLGRGRIVCQSLDQWRQSASPNGALAVTLSPGVRGKRAIKLRVPTSSFVLRRSFVICHSLFVICTYSLACPSCWCGSRPLTGRPIALITLAAASRRKKFLHH